MPAVASGKGKSKDGNYISQEAQWLASGGVETEWGAWPSVSDRWVPSESLRTSPNVSSVSSASSASERSALLELSPRAPGALHPLSPIPPTSAMLRAVQEQLTGRRAALSETGRIPAVRSLSKGPSLEQSCGREGAWRWPGGQAEP